MLQRRILSAVGASALLTLLTACNIGRAPAPTPDVNALYTEAAQTLIAQFGDQQTQTARAVTPTSEASPTALASPSPLPTFSLGSGLTPFGTFSVGLTPFGTLGVGASPAATAAAPAQYSFPVGCTDAALIKETVPDKTEMNAGQEFKKSWTLSNVGTCDWDEGFTFSFKAGERLSGSDVEITQSTGFVKPHESREFVITMKAPKAAGEFRGDWQMRSDEGVWFGSIVWVIIVVE